MAWMNTPPGVTVRQIARTPDPSPSPAAALRAQAEAAVSAEGAAFDTFAGTTPGL